MTVGGESRPTPLAYEQSRLLTTKAREDVDAPAVSFRSKRDKSAVWRERRLSFVDRIMRQLDRCAAGCLLDPDIKVVATGPIRGIGEQRTVLRQSRISRHTIVGSCLSHHWLRRLTSDDGLRLTWEPQ